MHNSGDTTRVFVSAAEPSGDLAGAQVVRCLSERGRSATFGLGGARMAAAGVELTADFSSFAGMGLTDPLRHLVRWADVWCSLREAIHRRPPDVALLVDAPDLNLPLARILKSMGVPVVYYIGPQVWAWRSRRLQLMKQRVTHTALILPFEEDLYAAAGVRASFVGHPLLDAPEGRSPDEVRGALGLGAEEKLVAMLPGSRPGEVDLIAPAMLSAAQSFASRGIRTVIAPGGECSVIGGSQFACPISLSTGELLQAADAALVASGTASLEAALAGVPFAIVYKVSKASALLARWLLDVPCVGLPNWVLGRSEIEEILQSELTGSRLVSVGESLLAPGAEARFAELSREIRGRMGGPGASARVAELVQGAAHANR